MGHALSATVIHIKEAVEVFKEKRATNNLYLDMDFCIRMAEKTEDKITGDLRMMHINIDLIMEELEEAHKKGTQQGATQGR